MLNCWQFVKKATADYKALEEKSTFDLREIKQDFESELDAERNVNKELRAHLTEWLRNLKLSMRKERGTNIVIV